MDVVAAVEAVGTPGGQPTARVVIEDCGIEPEAKDSITDSMPEYWPMSRFGSLCRRNFGESGLLRNLMAKMGQSVFTWNIYVL